MLAFPQLPPKKGQRGNQQRTAQTLNIRKSNPNPKTEHEISNFERSSIKHSVDLT